MSSNGRPPWDESCSPVSATVSRALRGAAQPRAVRAHALFVCLLLYPSCCPARRPRALLTENFGDWIADVSRFPQAKSKFLFRVPVDIFRDFSKEQATTVATEQSPGLVTAHGSFEAF